MSRVRDVLEAKGSTVLTVPPATTVARVAQRMRSEHIGAFVVSARVGQLDGLVSERDIVFAIARHGEGALELPVSAVMSRAPLTCAPDDSVRAVMAEMTRERVRHLPVIEHGQLRGIISIGDVVKASIDDADLETSVMRDAYLTGRARLAETG
jgi:CBS domain-containing protein